MRPNASKYESRQSRRPIPVNRGERVGGLLARRQPVSRVKQDLHRGQYERLAAREV